MRGHGRPLPPPTPAIPSSPPLLLLLPLRLKSAQASRPVREGWNCLSKAQSGQSLLGGGSDGSSGGGTRCRTRLLLPTPAAGSSKRFFAAEASSPAVSACSFAERTDDCMQLSGTEQCKILLIDAVIASALGWKQRHEAERQVTAARAPAASC